MVSLQNVSMDRVVVQHKCSGLHVDDRSVIAAERNTCPDFSLHKHT